MHGSHAAVQRAACLRVGGASCINERSNFMEQRAVVRQRRTPPAGLGPMLNSARMRAGYRSGEGARLVGISHSHLVNIEAGRRSPSLTVALRLADAFGMAVAVSDAGRDHPIRRNG
jgi:DNA-binding XRE family transcriptional regulator